MYSKILLDNPSDHPGLKFDQYASALKDIIELSDPQFSVGIFGGWGSGKTTLMHAIEDRLDNKIVSVWFNAWRYEKEEHLIVPLLDTLRDALITWAAAAENNPDIDSSFRDKAIKAASTVAKAARAIFAGMAIKAKTPLVEISLDANKTVAEWRSSDSKEDREDAEIPQSAYHASFKALKESLTEFTQRGKQRIVVFIDDLDRCLPANALQVLESMKLFFDLEGFVFVVGLDQKVIEASINWKYRMSDSSEAPTVGPPISGADYIKKLFQVPFNLPSISSSQLDDYLDAVFPSGEGRDQEQSNLMERVRSHLDALVGDSEVNPREVKRYINSYILQKLIQPDLDDDVTLVLQTIAFRPDWSEAYQVFRSKPDAFTEAAKRQLDGENDSLKALDSRLQGLPGAFFEYIDSKGGHKLLALDDSELKEHVRSFEATRSPESPIEIAREELIEAGQFIQAYSASDLTRDAQVLTQFQSRISRINESLSRLANEMSGARRDAILNAMRQLNDETERLAFSMRHGENIQSEDFDKILERRSNIADFITGILGMLDESLYRSQRSSSAVG